MSTTVVIKRFGNAKAIILPEELIRNLELERGSKMTICVEKGQIVLTPIRENKLSLDQLMKPTCTIKKVGRKSK